MQSKKDKNKNSWWQSWWATLIWISMLAGAVYLIWWPKSSDASWHVVFVLIKDMGWPFEGKQCSPSKAIG